MAQKWTPPQCWIGQDVYVVGAGPSLASFDTNRLCGKNVIACNHTGFQLGAHIVKILFFSDHSFFLSQRPQLEEFGGWIVTSSPNLTRLASPDWLLGVVRRHDGLHREAVGFGANSGCSAVNLALIMGASRVYLLGMDCRAIADKTHWDGRSHNSKDNRNVYQAFQNGWEAIADALPKVFPDRKIINATPGSAIEHFPRCTYEEAGL